MRENELRQDRIIDEAADWHARLRSPNVSELEAVRFRAWVSQDPRHRQEFDAIDSLWGELGSLQHARAHVTARREREPRPRSRAVIAASALLLLATIGGAFWMTFGRPTEHRFVTGIGEQRVIPLGDGSVLTLNTATDVRVRYSRGLRAVVLDSGQAGFEVARDADRPFVVSAGNGQVRAVGTQFDVYKKRSEVLVTLIEGRVAVSLQDASGADAGAALAGGSAGAAGSGEVQLSPGQQLSYSAARGFGPQLTANLERVSAWKRRKLEFYDTPLAEAIADANRYSDTQIELRVPSLDGARISGTFEAGKNDLLAEGIQAYFQLRAVRTADGNIVLVAP
jgi:transmembrane sensor